MTEENKIENQPLAQKKEWNTLELKEINVASNTASGSNGRVQPGEVINFYNNS